MRKKENSILQSDLRLQEVKLREFDQKLESSGKNEQILRQKYMDADYKLQELNSENENLEVQKRKAENLARMIAVELQSQKKLIEEMDQQREANSKVL